MDLETESEANFRKRFVLILTLACGVLFFAMIWGFLEALLLAAVFSGIVRPVYSWLCRVLRGRKTTASLLTLLLALVVIVTPLLFLFGLIAEQAQVVVNEVQPWVEQQISDTTESDRTLPAWFPFAERLEPYHDQVSAKFAQMAENIATYLGGSLARATQGTVMFFLNLFVMLYSMFFFLISGPELIRTIGGFTPLSQTDYDKLVQGSLSVGRATIKGTLIIGIIQGTLGGIGFAVAGINAAVFWGAVMAVLSVVPGIGSMLVWAPAVVYLLLTGQLVVGIALLAWCAGVVGTIDNVLRPTLVGRDTEMPDLLILLSTLGGLTLFGATGLVLGPMFAALFLSVLVIYSRVYKDWLKEPQRIDDDEPEN